MTTKLYMCLLGGLSAGFVLCVGLLAGLRIFALQKPQRPARMPANAVWRPTPAESVLLAPHGDWIACWSESTYEHCLLTDASGDLEYEGAFSPLPEDKPLLSAHLLPVTSDTISPWMWSKQANRLVPVIQLEDGTVLAPTGSKADLTAYVARIQKFGARLAPVPVYVEQHPAGSPGTFSASQRGKAK